MHQPFRCAGCLIAIAKHYIASYSCNSSSSNVAFDSQRSAYQYCKPNLMASSAHPTTAASTHAPCDARAASTSAVPTRCPLTLITSSTRPVIV